ncbi:ATP-binding cassette domain-containing protein [Aestuariirhabdus haliotis]|uniref:ATP-binding cassette domain-containing protein n=1 Tax=Aestuariirhabdus haliotis TaxID=2918751 RepID=UPI0020BED034|nr:ATP-binding cassette domain-containing protein [Aestuariirhabdus haliotis]MCL6420739.1 ATP-binding cassette domain-containing protein [Aestuariirhabdus haliotis]
MLDAILPINDLETADDLLPGEACNLNYQIRDKVLLQEINLKIEGRGTSIIMGANGAGKSLLLRLLHGMIVPSSGVVRWGGEALSPARRRRQAMVFQQPVLLRRSVAANIRFVLKLDKLPLKRQALRARIHNILASVGLENQAEQPARLLSGGEQQRLALARALALKPEVLFLDEPTASLDPASIAAIETIVQRCADQGMRILFVTHDIGQAKRLADDIIFLDQGRITEHTDANRFFQHPQSQAAQDYLAGRLRF